MSTNELTTLIFHLFQESVFTARDRWFFLKNNAARGIPIDIAAGLTNLDLSYASLATLDLTVLIRTVGPTIENLNLANNEFGDPGVFALAKGTWPRLQSLTLAGIRLGPVGAGALAMVSCPVLTTLCLGQNRSFSDVGLSNMLLSRPWPSLVSLDITYCGVTEASLLTLRQAKVPSLVTLLVSDNKYVQDEYHRNKEEEAEGSACEASDDQME